jgi:hypothetical protein
MTIITGTIAVSYIFAPIRHERGDIYAVKLDSGQWYTSIQPPQVIGANGSVQRLLQEPGAGTRCHVAYDKCEAGDVAFQALRGVKILDLIEPDNLFTGHPLETADN